MKNIYDLSKKELSELLIRFSKTHYGKIQFVLSYGLFVVLFIMLIISLCIYIQIKTRIAMTFVLFLALITFITFVQGSRHFYNEVRYFSDNEKHNR